MAYIDEGEGDARQSGLVKRLRQWLTLACIRNGDLISFSVSTLGKHYRTLQNLDKLVDNSRSF